MFFTIGVRFSVLAPFVRIVLHCKFTLCSSFSYTFLLELSDAHWLHWLHEYNAEIGDGVASQCVMRIAQWSIVSISSKPNNFACWRAMFSRFADHHSDCRHRRRRLWLCRWFTKVSVDLHSITSCTLSTQTIYTQLPAHISLTRDSSHCTFSPAAFLAHLQWASSILGSSTVTARQLKHIISEQFNLINRHYLWGQRTENWTHSK